MNVIALEIQDQYEKLMKELNRVKDIAPMLTDALVTANLKDVAESAEQQIEKNRQIYR